MNNVQMQQKIDIHNQAQRLIVALYPTINNMLKNAKRTPNKGLYKKDLAAINLMVKDTIVGYYPLIENIWFAINTEERSLCYTLDIRTVAFDRIKINWFGGRPTDYDFKPHILPDADVIIEKQQEFKDMHKEMEKLRSKIIEHQRLYNLNSRGDF